MKGLEILNPAQVRAIEPNVSAVAALHSPNTGIVDYAVVARSFVKDIEATNRGTIFLDFAVSRFEITPENTVRVNGCELHQRGPTKQVVAKNVITCAGLQSDRVAQLGGGSSTPRVVPFRGTYYQLKAEYKGLVTRNIYPVPSGGGIPVGVHFTPTVNERRGEQMIIGPGACLAFAREVYQVAFFYLLSILPRGPFYNCTLRFSLLTAGVQLLRRVLEGPHISCSKLWIDEIRFDESGLGLWGNVSRSEQESFSCPSTEVGSLCYRGNG